MQDQCNSFDVCNASMCPLSKNIENCIWYPDETICVNQKYNKLDWIKNQRKYSKRSVEGYYTLDMLKHNCIITSGTKGLNSDELKSEEKKQFKKWFKNHPIKKELAEEEKQQRAKNCKKARTSKLKAENTL